MKVISRIIFKVFLLFWIISFIYLDTIRVLNKIGYLYRNKNQISYNIGDSEDLTGLSEKLLITAKKSDRIIFISADSLSYMYFNLLSYPFISRWSRKLTRMDIDNNDVFVIFNYSSSLKNGVYKNYELD